MRISVCGLLSVLLAIPVLGQTPDATPAPSATPAPTPQYRVERMHTRLPHPPGPPRRMMMHTEMGQWWKDSDVAKKLQLSDAQISKLDSTFLDHKLKLIDDGAAMQKEDLKLQALLDQDSPDEAQVQAQVDKELAAKGALEREYTMMNLDLRKVLTVAQWHQLKAIRQEREPRRDVFFFRRFPGGGEMMGNGHGPMTLPAPPDPPPGPGGPAPDGLN